MHPTPAQSCPACLCRACPRRPGPQATTGRSGVAAAPRAGALGGLRRGGVARASWGAAPRLGAAGQQLAGAGGSPRPGRQAGRGSGLGARVQRVRHVGRGAVPRLLGRAGTGLQPGGCVHLAVEGPLWVAVGEGQIGGIRKELRGLPVKGGVEARGRGVGLLEGLGEQLVLEGLAGQLQLEGMGGQLVPEGHGVEARVVVVEGRDPVARLGNELQC
mmetsp:Transcript_48587/g.130827  ORF Transcript_48587/g.130827 Transcript_48587/m.130827 type:complete len:216 (-) Transcript_48587:645-1292(-)